MFDFSQCIPETQRSREEEYVSYAGFFFPDFTVLFKIQYITELIK